MPETTRTEYTVQGRSGAAVSSVQVTLEPSHARLRIWNRGGLAGELVVLPEDADEIVNLLTKERRVSWEHLAEEV